MEEELTFFHTDTDNSVYISDTDRRVKVMMKFWVDEKNSFIRTDSIL